jgi:hypothetical protein
VRELARVCLGKIADKLAPLSTGPDRDAIAQRNGLSKRPVVISRGFAGYRPRKSAIRRCAATFSTTR